MIFSYLSCFYILILFIHCGPFVVKTDEDVSSHLDQPEESNNDSPPTNDTRQGRTFLSDLGFLRPTLFNIVRFPNEECLDASNQSGTCYTALECKKLGGNPSSKCAKGLGTCCIMSRTCHNSTYNKVVYFKNPSFPLTDSDQNFCDLTVNVIDADICQLRIDFLEFQIDAPIEGICMGDKFSASASGMTPNSVPVLCGNNRNHHIYLTLPTNQEKRSVSIVFETNAMGDYRFHLKVTQIDCRVRQPSSSTSTFSSITQLSRESRTIYQKIPNQLTYPAPTGCLQYYTQSSGTIESFNFGQYLSSLDYAICIERQPDTCRVIYTASDANFGIESSGTSDANSAGVGDAYCIESYLLLMASSQTGDGRTYDRYCGSKLAYLPGAATETPVISKANGPIMIRFHSSESRKSDNREGFRIKYEQSPTDCPASNSANPNPFLMDPLNPFGPPMVQLLESGKQKPMKLPPFYHTQMEMKLDQISSSSPEKAVSNEASPQITNRVMEIKSRANGKRFNF